ncbi:MAG: GFA family protein [Gammaproteobacteria bacterium]|nr:GFA family protein [Gammaproteobacteria bacterium]
MIDSKQNIGLEPGQKLSGGCLCGSVVFEVEGPLRDLISCYCSQCRTSSGNFVTATGVPDKRLRMLDSGALAWYKNGEARRGFCQNCGSSLFWLPEHRDGSVRIMAGCLDPANGLEVKAHIFVHNKSDFHEIAGSAPQYCHGDHGIPVPD